MSSDENGGQDDIQITKLERLVKELRDSPDEVQFVLIRLDEPTRPDLDVIMRLKHPHDWEGDEVPRLISAMQQIADHLVGLLENPDTAESTQLYYTMDGSKIVSVDQGSEEDDLDVQ